MACGVKVDVKRIEFVITKACTSNCKHCSADIDSSDSGGVKSEYAIDAIKKLARRYKVESIMTFGGEPLLYADTVCKIHSAAKDCQIPGRAVITNGFFSKENTKIESVAAALCASGANNIFLSVDAFHQEHVSIEPVIHFAKSLLKNNVHNLRVHPAWLVSKDDKNPYNEETRRLLKIFRNMGIEVSKGNLVFPAGNATKYLRKYFSPPQNVDLSIACGQMPYTTKLDEVSCVSIEPNGDLSLCAFSIGNIYKEDVLDILDRYDPHNDPATSALLEGGAHKLLEYTDGIGLNVDVSDCYSSCQVCKKIMKLLKKDGGHARL